MLKLTSWAAIVFPLASAATGAPRKSLLILHEGFGIKGEDAAQRMT
jgi:hypothetical protein